MIEACEQKVKFKAEFKTPQSVVLHFQSHLLFILLFNYFLATRACQFRVSFSYNTDIYFVLQVSLTPDTKGKHNP